MVRVEFLGTGTSQGVPMIGCTCRVCRSEDTRDKRLRASVMVESAGKRIVIDAGPDFRTQMLRSQVNSLDAVLLTHQHKDHTAGLDDVRAFNYWDARPMPVFATARTIEALQKDFDYAFKEPRYPGVPEMELHQIEAGVPFNIGELEILPVEGLHYKLPVVGFRIEEVAYLTDMNTLPDESIALLNGVKILIINALRWTEHLSHFTVDEAIAVAKKVGALKTFLTHTSHQLGLHTEASARLPKGIEIAYDGLKINL